MRPLFFFLFLLSWQATYGNPVLLELPGLDADGEISPARWESYFSDASNPEYRLSIPREWYEDQHQAWLDAVVAYNMNSYRNHLFELTDEAVDAQLAGLSRLRDQLFDDPGYHDFELGRVINNVLFEYIRQTFFAGEVTPEKADRLMQKYKIEASQSRALTLLRNLVEAEDESAIKKLTRLASFDQMLHSALDFWIGYAKSGGSYIDTDKTVLKTEVRPYYTVLDGFSRSPNENELSILVNFTDGTDPFTFYTRLPRGMRGSVPPLSIP